MDIKRAEGGRGIVSVEDCVEIETNSQLKYIIESEEKWLKAVKDEGILGEGTSKEEIADKRRNQYKEKPLHGQYVRSTEEIRDYKSWNWLKRGTLKKETEGTLMAAQNQALRTNAIKSRIDKQDISPCAGFVAKEKRRLAILLQSARNSHRSNAATGTMTGSHWLYTGHYAKDLDFPTSRNHPRNLNLLRVGK